STCRRSNRSASVREDDDFPEAAPPSIAIRMKGERAISCPTILSATSPATQKSAETFWRSSRDRGGRARIGRRAAGRDNPKCQNSWRTDDRDKSRSPGRLGADGGESP